MNKQRVDVEVERQRTKCRSCEVQCSLCLIDVPGRGIGGGCRGVGRAGVWVEREEGGIVSNEKKIVLVDAANGECD